MDYVTLNVRDIIMVFSALAIFGTLVAMIIQNKKNGKVARSQAYQSITNSANDFARFTMSYPDALEFLKTWSYDPKTMQRLTDTQAWWVAMMALDFWENLFYQKESGILPKPLWGHWRNNIRNNVTRPGFHSYWDPVKSHYSEKFRQFIDSLS